MSSMTLHDQPQSVGLGDGWESFSHSHWAQDQNPACILDELGFSTRRSVD